MLLGFLFESDSPKEIVIVTDKKINYIIYPLTGLAGAIILHFVRNFLVTSLNNYGIGFALAVILNLILILLFFLNANKFFEKDYHLLLNKLFRKSLLIHMLIKINHEHTNWCGNKECRELCPNVQ